MGFPLVGQKAIGFRTMFGSWVSPGARVTFLGPAGIFEDTYTENNRVATLNAACARLRSGKNDVIIALPGYAETVDIADFATSLVTGSQLIGIAPFNSSLMPTLTFSATTSTILLDVANVQLSGFKFVSSVDAVANFLTVSGAGCKVSECVFDCGTSSALDVTTPVIVAAGADNFEFANNRMFSISTAVSTNGLSVTGAVAGLKVHDNDIDLTAGGATNGIIDIGAFAVSQGRIYSNLIRNRRAAAAVAIRIADTAGSEGAIYDNYFSFAADVTALSAAISAATSVNHGWRAFQNFAHDENIMTGIVTQIGTGGTIE
jgi:hypothetical protein